MNKKLVISDIHGQVDYLLAAINEYPSHDYIFLGDIFDRGPDSFRSFEIIRELVDQKNAILLLGNHELMIIESFLNKNIEAFRFWIQSGWGGDMVMHELARLENIPEVELYEMIEFSTEKILDTPRMIEIATWLMQNCKIYHTYDDTLFVHAGMAISALGQPISVFDDKYGLEMLETMQNIWKQDPVTLLSSLHSEQSHLWVRPNQFIQFAEKNMKKYFDEIDPNEKIKKMVIGHTKFAEPKIVGNDEYKIICLDIFDGLGLLEIDENGDTRLSAV